MNTSDIAFLFLTWPALFLKSSRAGQSVNCCLWAAFRTKEGTKACFMTWKSLDSSSLEDFSTRILWLFSWSCCRWIVRCSTSLYCELRFKNISLLFLQILYVKLDSSSSVDICLNKNIVLIFLILLLVDWTSLCIMSF